jgi:hypothetical protein
MGLEMPGRLLVEFLHNLIAGLALESECRPLDGRLDDVDFHGCASGARKELRLNPNTATRVWRHEYELEGPEETAAAQPDRPHEVRDDAMSLRNAMNGRTFVPLPINLRNRYHRY